MTSGRGKQRGCISVRGEATNGCRTGWVFVRKGLFGPPGYRGSFLFEEGLTVPQDGEKFGSGERRGGCGSFNGTPQKARNCGDRLKCTSALSAGIAKVHPGKRVFLSRLGDRGLHPYRPRTVVRGHSPQVLSRAETVTDCHRLKGLGGCASGAVRMGCGCLSCREQGISRAFADRVQDADGSGAGNVRGGRIPTLSSLHSDIRTGTIERDKTRWKEENGMELSITVFAFVIVLVIGMVCFSLSL